MPKKLDTETTLDDHEEEVFFTRAAIQSDPDAADLLPTTDGWLPMVDAVRVLGREKRQKVANSDAARVVANTRLDISCLRFGARLLLDVAKDRKAGRWLQFFATHTATSFTKQALSKQVIAVKAWAGITDETFAEHKDSILGWNDKATHALDDTAGVATVRGQFAMGEERLAEDMTRERDGLHARLVQRATEKKLPRDWADSFFKVERRKRGSGAEEPEPTQPVE